MRVLITGAAGHIGRVLTAGLATEHELRGLDLRASGGAFPGRFFTGDCADPALVSGAVDGVDAVVHLAGIATESDLSSILHTHVKTTAAVLQAMVDHGVSRLVHASSNHAVGMTPRSDMLSTTVSPRPDTFYGVGKVAAEALLSLYSDRHGISSVALRIGSFLEQPETRRNLATWLSYRDCVALVQAALVADVVGVSVVYGISANTDAWWDLEPGRLLGYHPQDDATAFRDRLTEGAEDADEAAHVGGPYATPSFSRRPFTDRL